MSMLSGCDANAVRLESLADGGMTQYIIWSCRLLDEPRLNLLELLDIVDGLWNIPNLSQASASTDGYRNLSYLVGVDHENRTSWSGILAYETGWVWSNVPGWEILWVVDD